MVDQTDTILQDIQRRHVLPSGVDPSDAAEPLCACLPSYGRDVNASRPGE
jgi:hypothetical protein